MPDQPSPRRRFQFRLRTLMIGVTLVCVIAGWIGWVLVKNRYDDQYGPPFPPPGWVPQPRWTGPPIDDPDAHRKWMEEWRKTISEKLRAVQHDPKDAQRHGADDSR